MINTLPLPLHVRTQAMERMGACCVPLYETLGDNAIEYIVDFSTTKLIVAQVRAPDP